MTLVADASVLVAALVDAGDLGEWARGLIEHEVVVAPHVLPVEVASAVRRLAAGGTIAQGFGHAALDDLEELNLELYPFLPFRRRVWELRASVTAYDAWYVALAEAQECAVATLDRRLVGASGPRCEFVTP